MAWWQHYLHFYVFMTSSLGCLSYFESCNKKTEACSFFTNCLETIATPWLLGCEWPSTHIDPQPMGIEEVFLRQSTRDQEFCSLKGVGSKGVSCHL